MTPSSTATGRSTSSISLAPTPSRASSGVLLPSAAVATDCSAPRWRVVLVVTKFAFDPPHGRIKRLLDGMSLDDDLVERARERVAQRRIGRGLRSRPGDAVLQLLDVEVLGTARAEARGDAHGAPRGGDRTVRLRHPEHLLRTQEELQETPRGVSVGRVRRNAPLPRARCGGGALAEIRQRDNLDVTRKRLRVPVVEPVTYPRDRASALLKCISILVRVDVALLVPLLQDRQRLHGGRSVEEAVDLAVGRSVDQISARRPDRRREAVAVPLRVGLVELQIERL